MVQRVVSTIMYLFEVTLASGTFSIDLDSTFGSDPNEAFDWYFHDHGFTDSVYPCLKVGIISLPENSCLTGLSWDSEGEYLEGSTPTYEIQSASGDDESGWNYNFRLLITFSAQISADNFEQAIAQIKNEVIENLAIYDGGSDEIVDIDDVRLVRRH